MLQPRKGSPIRYFCIRFLLPTVFEYYERFILHDHEVKLTWMVFFVQNQNSPRRSKSLKHKNGEYICFLASDGLWKCWSIPLLVHSPLQFGTVSSVTGSRIWTSSTFLHLMIQHENVCTKKCLLNSQILKVLEEWIWMRVMVHSAVPFYNKLFDYEVEQCVKQLV